MHRSKVAAESRPQGIFGLVDLNQTGHSRGRPGAETNARHSLPRSSQASGRVRSQQSWRCKLQAVLFLRVDGKCSISAELSPHRQAATGTSRIVAEPPAPIPWRLVSPRASRHPAATSRLSGGDIELLASGAAPDRPHRVARIGRCLIRRPPPDSLFSSPVHRRGRRAPMGLQLLPISSLPPPGRNPPPGRAASGVARRRWPCCPLQWFWNEGRIGTPRRAARLPAISRKRE